MRANAYIKRRIAITCILAFLAPLCLLPAFGQLEHDLVAEDDEVFITMIEPVVIDVLNNDIDNFAHDLTITQVTTAAFGTVSIDPGAQSITYTPGEGFVEEDVFTYEVSDGELSAFATVTVTLGDPVPPRDTRGTYDGIIQGIAGPLGVIKVALSTSDNASRFTASARFDGKTYRFKGVLASGSALVSLPGGNNVTFALGSAFGFNTVGGQITVGGVTGSFTASQHTFGLRAPTPKVGKYTLVADNDPNNFPAPEYPQGTTWANVTITHTGLMRIRGKLGDGKVLSAGVVVRETFDSPSGEAPLFAAPYTRGSGMFSGVLTFVVAEDPDTPDFDGSIQWVRPPSTKGAYANGFTLDVSLMGGRYHAPRGTSALDWTAADNQGQLYTDDGNQPNDVLKKLVSIAGLNKIVIDDPGTDKFKLKIGPGGLVTGSFVIEGQKAPTRVTGVVLQKFGGLIEGQFLGRGRPRGLDQIGWLGVFPGRDDNTAPPQRAAE